MFWRSVAPLTEEPDRRVLLPVRDPIERFRSAVAMLNMDVDAAIGALATTADPHFAPQTSYLRPETAVYQFPDAIEAFCAEAGLFHPLPVVNRGRRAKPTLTAGQIRTLHEHYAEDFRLLFG